jgi:site-specific DNA recombinase
MAATSKVLTAPKPVRCATYSRKSTEEGLNQAFNSLDAQREAGEAYILSQKHDGWTLVPSQYSDGGYTGANIERPGVRQLMADIEAGKQVAARKKRKWTGGHKILGYDLDSQAWRLTVNPDEAERVREIFRIYLEGTPVLEMTKRLDRLGWRNKQWTTREGKLYGGSPLRRCHIYNLLGNILYTGQVKVGDEIFPGEHDGIIDQQTFDLAQARLKENAWTPGNEHRIKMDALLRGITYCSRCGSGMYSTYSANKERRYRYYVCYKSQQKLEGYCTSRSVSAPSVEDAVVESIRRVSVHPDVLAETAILARQRIAEIAVGLREELNATNGRVKNLKSQIARLRNPEPKRLAEIHSNYPQGTSVPKSFAGRFCGWRNSGSTTRNCAERWSRSRTCGRP